MIRDGKNDQYFMFCQMPAFLLANKQNTASLNIWIQLGLNWTMLFLKELTICISYCSTGKKDLQMAVYVNEFRIPWNENLWRVSSTYRPLGRLQSIMGKRHFLNKQFSDLPTAREASKEAQGPRIHSFARLSVLVILEAHAVPNSLISGRTGGELYCNVFVIMKSCEFLWVDAMHHRVSSKGHEKPLRVSQ